MQARSKVLLVLAMCVALLTTGVVAAYAYNEAPELAALVKEGKLPSIEERLPSNPVIVDAPQVGRYGGAMQVGIVGPSVWYGDPQSVIGPETLVRLAPDYKGVVPNIASYKFEDGGKTLILSLHPGIRWSDGVPFTADDLMFWYEDIILNDELTPSKPVDWSPGGELVKMEKIDEYTVAYKFAVPYPQAIFRMAHYPGSQGMFPPKHYLKQFHPNYVDRDKLTAMAKEAGFDEWYQLFQERNRIRSCIPAAVGLPTLSAWVLTKESPTSFTFERNPYYWKVDKAGNQLPYIDKVHFLVIEDREVLNLKATSGELSIFGENSTLTNYPIYKENQKTGNYSLMMWKSVYSNQVILQPNQTIGDPALREIFRDKRFRIALSLGIDREEINQALYFGLGKPMQTTVSPTSSYYEEEFAQAYVDYDPDKANGLLDEMGLDKRDSDGFRLRPDGKRLAITLEFPMAHTPALPVTEMVKEYWENLGIQIAIKQLSNELQSTRVQANEIEMTEWYADKSMDHTFPMYPMWFVPYNWNWETTWGVEWAHWYATGGKEGEEPPAEAKRLLDLWDEMKQTVDEARQLELGKEILKSQAENLWTIGTVGDVPIPLIVDARLANVPEDGVHGYDTIRMQPQHPEVFFFAE